MAKASAAASAVAKAMWVSGSTFALQEKLAGYLAQCLQSDPLRQSLASGNGSNIVSFKAGARQESNDEIARMSEYETIRQAVETILWNAVRLPHPRQFLDWARHQSSTQITSQRFLRAYLAWRFYMEGAAATVNSESLTDRRLNEFAAKKVRQRLGEVPAGTWSSWCMATLCYAYERSGKRQLEVKAITAEIESGACHPFHLGDELVYIFSADPTLQLLCKRVPQVCQR